MEKELEPNEFYALFSQGRLRTPMLHRSLRQIRRVKASFVDDDFIDIKKVRIEITEL